MAMTKEERLETIEIIKESLKIVLEENNKMLVSSLKVAVKEAMDSQTDRFLKVINSHEKAIEKMDKEMKDFKDEMKEIHKRQDAILSVLLKHHKKMKKAGDDLAE